MERIATIGEGNELCNQIKMAGIEFPANVSIEVKLTETEFEWLVEEVGRTYKIQKSMFRQGAIKMEVNGVSIIYKKYS
jgi:hypothetical protein